jgi:glycerol-3-phosphate acyltransferase PlsY
MTILFQTLAIIVAYLLGAVPFGLLFSRLFSNVDVRTVGSGNIGATNVLRAAGKKAAALTLFADCFKGFLPVLAVRLLFHDHALESLAGVAAVLGHNFPVYLRFKGGKGVATSYGVVLATVPWIGLVCLIAWLFAAAVWRYSSLSALFSFVFYPVLTFALYKDSRPMSLLSLFIFGMIYYRHRDNIKRLISGTEPKIGRN